jgi:hypothetical protein
MAHAFLIRTLPCAYRRADEYTAMEQEKAKLAEKHAHDVCSCPIPPLTLPLPTTWYVRCNSQPTFASLAIVVGASVL